MYRPPRVRIFQDQSWSEISRLMYLLVEISLITNKLFVNVLHKKVEDILDEPYSALLARLTHEELSRRMLIDAYHDKDVAEDYAKDIFEKIVLNFVKEESPILILADIENNLFANKINKFVFGVENLSSLLEFKKILSDVQPAFYLRQDMNSIHVSVVNELYLNNIAKTLVEVIGREGILEFFFASIENHLTSNRQDLLLAEIINDSAFISKYKRCLVSFLSSKNGISFSKIGIKFQ